MFRRKRKKLAKTHEGQPAESLLNQIVRDHASSREQDLVGLNFKKAFFNLKKALAYMKKSKCASPGLTSPTSMLHMRSEMLARFRQEGRRGRLCHFNENSTFVVI